MNRAEYKEWDQKAMSGELKDEENPIFILSTVSSFLIAQIAKGEINLQELAKRELENRGLNIDGVWVGFGKEIQ